MCIYFYFYSIFLSWYGSFQNCFTIFFFRAVKITLINSFVVTYNQILLKKKREPRKVQEQFDNFGFCNSKVQEVKFSRLQMSKIFCSRDIFDLQKKFFILRCLQVKKIIIKSYFDVCI